MSAASSALRKVTATESLTVLRRLLELHPELGAEADAIATGVVTNVDPNDVGNAVRHAVLDLDLDDR